MNANDKTFLTASGSPRTLTMTNLGCKLINSRFTTVTVENTSSTTFNDSICSIDGGSIDVLTLRATGTKTLTTNISNLSVMPSPWTIDGVNSIVKLYQGFDTAPTLANSAVFSPTVLYSGILKTNATTASTSSTTGALVSAGGLGVAGETYLGSTLHITDTTDSSSLTTGSFITAGGISAAKKAYFGDDVTIGPSQTIVKSQKLVLRGTNASESGPHLAAYTSTDQYPVFQQLNWSHDNIALTFDAYINSGWISSHSGSNYQVYKVSNQLQFNYGNHPAAGSAVTWTTSMFLDNVGNIVFGGAVATNATNGFFKISTCAGTPTGAPTQGNGCLVIDTTNNKMYCYSSGAWRILN